jgi:hypothetical protein
LASQYKYKCKHTSDCKHKCKKGLGHRGEKVAESRQP